MTPQFTVRAAADVRNCMEWSAGLFGKAAARRYRRLITVAISELAADPNLTGSRSYGSLPLSVRIYHLKHSRKRAAVDGTIVKRPRHFIVYRPLGEDILEVLRVLDERMDLERHEIGPE